MKKFFIILSVLFGVNSQSYGFIIEANCSFDQAHGIVQPVITLIVQSCVTFVRKDKLLLAFG
jgi:hypothetical protein